MPVGSCRECGQQVSMLAEACPHCGAPVARLEARNKSRTLRAGCLALIGVLMLVILITLLARDRPKSSRQPLAETAIPPQTLPAEAIHPDQLGGFDRESL